KKTLKNGTDIVSISGDKLLGGLQCGIILGCEKYIDAMKKHPLYRAFRVDKITIAALEATLRVYKDPNVAEREIPVLSMLSLTEDALRLRAEKLCEKIHERGGVEIVRTKSVAGGGSVPGLELGSYAISPVLKIGASEVSAEEIDRRLRAQPVPIIGHIENDRLLLDLRTIIEDDYEYIIEVITGL
ncbi:MAG: L-seryl-tRNA(Sec) selenium transferase, partial [Oscillospiraceae bacterium]|nr:L-seryl-tRNA(Sec) selenium transferase [Oscillospiraceae bacterium]